MQKEPGLESPALPVSFSPHLVPPTDLLEHIMLSHKPLSVLRIVCSPSITWLTPIQASKPGFGVASSRKPPLIPNLPLVPSLGSCKPSVSASSYHVVISVYILIFSLRGQSLLLNHHCTFSFQHRAWHGKVLLSD